MIRKFKIVKRICFNFLTYNDSYDAFFDVEHNAIVESDYTTLWVVTQDDIRLETNNTHMCVELCLDDGSLEEIL
jgi:hypothetical protein